MDPKSVSMLVSAELQRRRNNRGKLSNDDIKAVVEMFLAGRSLRQIADKFGVTATAIHERINKIAAGK